MRAVCSLAITPRIARFTHGPYNERTPVIQKRLPLNELYTAIDVYVYENYEWLASIGAANLNESCTHTQQTKRASTTPKVAWQCRHFCNIICAGRRLDAPIAPSPFVATPQTPAPSTSFSRIEPPPWAAAVGRRCRWTTAIAITQRAKGRHHHPSSVRSGATSCGAWG